MGKKTGRGAHCCLGVVMLSLSCLSASALQQARMAETAGEASSPEKPGQQQPKLQPPLDQATYLRIRMQLANGFGLRPACESDTPTGHAEEVQRALKVFPEIRQDTETFHAAIQQLGLKEVENFSNDEELLIYRQYENLTSIHLEPLGKNDNQDSYTLTFVPNHQPHCDPRAESTIRSMWVNVDQQGRATVGALSTSVNSMSTTVPLSELSRQTEVAPESRPPIRVEKITAPELRYRLLEEFGRRQLCLCAPVCRGDETERELDTFNEIKKDANTFRVIIEHLGFVRTNQFTDAEKLAVYREYEHLRTVDLELLVGKYKFITIANNLRTQGLIDIHGQITILVRKAEPASHCPVCLAGSTRIDTPYGAVPVRELKMGMLVWTIDVKGQKLAVPILKTSTVPVPQGHRMVHLLMKDGRGLWASPGHPTVDGRTVIQLNQNVRYDGSEVSSSEVVPYEETSTYDLLPAGSTGFYWANGILLASTLR